MNEAIMIINSKSRWKSARRYQPRAICHSVLPAPLTPSTQ